MLHDETEDPVFVYIWKIQNFSFCGLKKGNPLISPRFTIHNLQSTLWTLSCYPRGRTYDNHVGVCLQRAASDDGSSEIEIGFEIALVDTNDSRTYRTGYPNLCFRNGDVLGLDLLVRGDLLRTQRSTLLPEDTLTFRCRIWKKYTGISCPTYCFARTCIGVHQSVFNCTIPRFSSLLRNQRIPFYVCSTSMQYALLTMEILLNDDDKIQIYITGSRGRNTSRLAKLKITLLDTNGRTERFVQDEHLFTSMAEVWSITTTFTRYELIEQKIRFLPYDDLTLLCHCRISDGIESSRIERTVYEVHPTEFEDLIPEDADAEDAEHNANTASEHCQVAEDPGHLKFEDQVTQNKEDSSDKTSILDQETLPTRTECASSSSSAPSPRPIAKESVEATSNSSKLDVESREKTSLPGSQQNTSAGSIVESSERSDHCDNSPSDSLKSDLKCLYQEETVSDFTIKVSAKLFPVHKALLCARSPVFKAMLTSNMKETVSQVMEVSDLDVGTVSRLLIFIYTDAVDDLEWEAATKLYFAADKYGVTALQRLCTTVLKSSLCVANVGDILALAELHGDGDLKETANNFIFAHDTEVMCSAEWRNFMQKEVLLAAETMRLMYVKKSENLK